MVNSNKFNQGFTLIELMIVVSVIAILAAIAYPNYQTYQIKSRRADTMLELQNIATRIASRKLVEGVYTNISLPQVMGADLDNGSVAFPHQGTAYYDIMIVDATTNSIMHETTSTHPNRMTNSQWVIQAIPRSTSISQNDGTLTLDNDGTKCRVITDKTTGNQVKKCGMDGEWNSN